MIMGDKDCFLSYSIVESDNILYSKNIDKSSYCFDSFLLRSSEWCYGITDGEKNHNCIHLLQCRDCMDCAFCFDCVGCQNCFLSSNQRNKQFLFQNKQCSPEEFKEKVNKIHLGSFVEQEKLYSIFKDVIKRSLHKYAQITKSVDVTGDSIANSKNVRFAFDSFGSKDCAYGLRFYENAKDCYDILFCGNSELVYESIAPGFQSAKLLFSVVNDSSRELYYSSLCLGNNKNLFGCVGLRNKQYCILNRQYTKEEYEKLVPRIIEHMNTMPYVDAKGRVYKYGEFFPPELSPFAYNETIAEEYFPLSKEEAIQQGYRWKDPDPKQYTITKKPEDLPDHIKDVPDSILKEVIACAASSDPQASGCTTAFKIIPEELAFYRKMHLPLPRLCPNCRHYERLRQRNPLKLWHRTCQCAGKESENGAYANTVTHQHGGAHCPSEFETSYAPDRKEIVYCEQCYNAEVV